MTDSELEARVALMRRLGVVEWDGIKLGPAPAAVTPLDTETKVRKLVKAGKRGKDGLTYDEQVALYTVALDATPDEFEE